MGLFGRKKQAKKDDNAFLQAKLDGRLVRYVTRREPDENGNTVETVLGKDGRICATNGYVAVIAGGKEVFRCDAADASMSELMSLEGAVVKGPNSVNGKDDTVVAYYKYYR